MRSIKGVYFTVIVLAISAMALFFMPSPPSHISMIPVDRYENVLPDGQRMIFNMVEIDGVDSMLFRDYAAQMYHTIVPDSVGKSMPVQVITYFYQPENLKELHPMRLFQMSGGDKKRMQLLRKLASDSAGYFAVRFSDVYQLMQRDTLYVQAGEVIIPRFGTQLKDFFSPPPSRE